MARYLFRWMGSVHQRKKKEISSFLFYGYVLYSCNRNEPCKLCRCQAFLKVIYWCITPPDSVYIEWLGWWLMACQTTHVKLCEVCYVLRRIWFFKHLNNWTSHIHIRQWLYTGQIKFKILFIFFIWIAPFPHYCAIVQFSLFCSQEWVNYLVKGQHHLNRINVLITLMFRL